MLRLDQIDSAKRHNNLNFIRLVAATSVAFAHSFALLLGDPKPIWNGLFDSGMFGFVPVAVFFGLSGFLITQSWERRKSWFQYFEARWLRIFPGLFFSCLVTTILVSQFVLDQGWAVFADVRAWRQTFGAFFFDYSYYNGVFDSNPTHGVNGSLWTLPIEFRMYLFVMAFGLVGIVSRRWLFLAFAAAMLLGGIFQIEFVMDKIWPVIFRIKNHAFYYWSLPFCFVMGMLAYMFRERVILNVWVGLAMVLSSYFLHHWAYICVAYVYFALSFGYDPRFYLAKLDFKADLSYGIYVLAFPIQQTLIFEGIRPEPHLFFLITMACTVPTALVSWYLFEKPGLKLKGRLRRKHGDPSAKRTGHAV